MVSKTIPKLITFDGEARSGKGTIVHAVKDYLRDDLGYKVMLIDAGQVFRVLVVAASEAGVDLDSPPAIDAFLSDETQIEKSVQFVKEVYRMSKERRDDLLYAHHIGMASAKVGARPLSQSFKDRLLKKWLQDAHKEGFDIVLLDGRALEEVGMMLEKDGLCQFVLGFYFTSDPVVGARRTLKFATTPYKQLGALEKHQVDELVKQIRLRNHADRERAVQPIIPPKNAKKYALPEVPEQYATDGRLMVIFDTSAEMTKERMTRPVARFIGRFLKKLG
jgi:cytidylate kinase